MLKKSGLGLFAVLVVPTAVGVVSGQRHKERCIAKPETYEARKSRREAEIAGLKEALSILEGETAFVQRGGKRHGSRMRGSLKLDV